MCRMIPTLPWVDEFLTNIKNEYRLAYPYHKEYDAEEEEINYILSQTKGDDPFDKGGLKKDSAKAIESNKARVIKSQSPHGQIYVVSFKESPFYPPWNTWWRLVRLLVPEKKVRIVVFGHPRERRPPEWNKNIGAEHINGGSAMRCDPRTILIYRKEEATRVLIHELLHASCTDPYHKDTPNIEADTEAWAELILCGVAARGNKNRWTDYLREQFKWSTQQAATLRDKYRVHGSKEYAWRYLVGRIDVWKRLGFKIPPIPGPSEYKPVDSLRFTICEPQNN